MTVTEAAFFRFVGLRNIYPRWEPDRLVWINQDTRAVVGYSTPGYKCRGRRTYTLKYQHEGSS